MSEPRTKSGRRLHHISDDAYVVLVDRDGVEAGERVAGAVWVAFGRQARVEVIFNPDTLGLDGTTSLWPARACVVKAWIFIDGDQAFEISNGWQAMASRDRYIINWGEMMDVMA
jgi:hypothetical protein